MKKCSYCGAEYLDDATWCAIDNNPLDGSQNVETSSRSRTDQAVPDAVEEILTPPISELSGLDMGFSFVEGFSRPDWKMTSQFIRDRVPRDYWQEAWRYAVSLWLKALSEDLGGDSRVYQTSSFSCLSDLKPDTTKTLLDYAERIVGEVRQSL
jgi:hypothetical protein